MHIAKVEFMLTDINNDLGRYVENLDNGVIDDLAKLDNKVLNVCEEASKLSYDEFEIIRDNFENTLIKLRIFKEKLDINIKETQDKIIEVTGKSEALRSYSKRSANDNTP